MADTWAQKRGDQFVLTVTGFRLANDTETTARKRWPSGLTSNAVHTIPGGSVNSVSGLSMRNWFARMRVARTRPSGATQISSPVARDH